MNEPTRLQDRSAGRARPIEGRAPVEPLTYRLSDLPVVLGLGKRTVTRLLARGDLPRPDRVVGRTPLWLKSTIVDWMTAKGGGR